MAAADEVLVANQPVVHPAKAWGDLPLPIRSEQMFANHKQDLWLSRTRAGWFWKRQPQNVSTLFYHPAGGGRDVLL